MIGNAKFCEMVAADTFNASNLICIITLSLTVSLLPLAGSLNSIGLMSRAFA